MAKIKILKRIHDALIRTLSPTAAEDWRPVELAVFAVGKGVGIQLQYDGYKTVTTVLPVEGALSLQRAIQTVIAQAEINSRQGH